jgi:hypothetical protein
MMCVVSGGQLEENMSNFIETFSVTCVDDERWRRKLYFFSKSILIILSDGLIN